MKIAIFSNSYLPNTYGVTVSIESFRKEYERLGHEVYIFAPTWRDYKDTNSNVYRYPSLDVEFKIRFPLAIPYSRKMNEVLGNFDFDIVHTQNANLLGTAAMKWAKRKSVPIVYTWHTRYDAIAHFFPIVPRRFSASFVMKKALSFANRCDALVLPTHSMKEIVESWGSISTDAEIISSGVDEAILSNPDTTKIRRSHRIGDDETILLVITRITAEKNLEFLFRAVFKILKKDFKTKLLVGGEGYSKKYLERMVFENNLQDQVIFLGLVPQQDLKNYYAASDIFLSASIAEAQGLALTEAMYLGLPVVAVDATGVRDIVRPNVTGFLTSLVENSFTEGILKLIEDKDLRKRFGEASKVEAKKNYTTKICSTQMLGLFERLIAKKKKP